MAYNLILRPLPIAALLCLLVLHFWVVDRYSLNIPYQDDIIDFLRFINRVESADGFGDALEAWFFQHNNHRTTATRLQVYALFLLQGEVNFHTHAIMGNVALPLILYVLYLTVREHPNRWLYLLVAGFLILNIRTHGAVTWGQPAFAYFWVYVYSFASIYALHQVSVPRFFMASLFAILACLTFAAGLIVWLIGLLSLLHQSLVIRRCSPGYAAAWLVVSVAAIAGWRIGLIPTPTEFPPETVEALRLHFPDLLLEPTFFELWQRRIVFFIVMLGSAVTDSSAWLAGVLGMGMLSMLAYFSWSGLRQDDMRLVLYAWFSVLSVAALSIGRAFFGPPEFFLAGNSRYCFLSLMVIVTLTMLIQSRIKRFQIYLLTVPVLLSGLYALSTYHSYLPELKKLKNQRTIAYNKGNIVLFGLDEEVSAIINEAADAGRITLPCRPYPACKRPQSQTTTQDTQGNP